MDRTYKLSFIGNITIQVMATLFFLVLAYGSGHGINLNFEYYLLFAHPILTVLSVIALKVLKEASEGIQNIIRAVLGLLLFVSLYFVLQLLLSSYQENSDMGFIIVLHLFMLPFFVLNFIVLYGLIRKKI